MTWQPFETAPKYPARFLALNHDGEIWVATFTKDDRLCFRTNWRDEYTTHRERELDDGTRGMVRDDAATVDKWRSSWTIWARLYDFKPTHWMPLPEPPK